MAAVASVSHVQPQLVRLWGIPGETINLPLSGPILPARGRARLPVSGKPLHVTAECVATFFLPPSWTTSLRSTQSVPDSLSSDRVIAPGHQVASASTTLPAAPAPSLYLPFIALSFRVGLLYYLRNILDHDLALFPLVTSHPNQYGPQQGTPSLHQLG